MIVIEDYLIFVKKVVQSFRAKRRFKPSTFEDLFQEGCIALIHAAEKYKDDKGMKFTTFAAMLIKQRISTASWEDRMIRLPLWIQWPSAKKGKTSKQLENTNKLVRLTKVECRASMNEFFENIEPINELRESRLNAISEALKEINGKKMSEREKKNHVINYLFEKGMIQK
jgi:RNA polymerase sigma factor (sigma-70 family)